MDAAPSSAELWLKVMPWNRLRSFFKELVAEFKGISQH
jgi:hypothetical protein